MTGTILKRYKRLLSLIAVPLLILALALSPAVGADDDGDIKVVGDEQLLDEVPAGYSYEAPGYENGGHGVNAAGMDDIPVADDCIVMGDEELLDSVWEKACTDIELPDGAILTIKAVIAPEESNIGGVPATIWVNTPSEEFGKTYCSYYFQHLVDGELVDGDRYVIVINADTLERRPVVERTPLYITGSLEESLASARPMIWDGSCPTLRIGPFHEVRAGYSYEAPGYENGGHGVNAAGMDDIPVADDCVVMGDEELLDSVWEKACTDIELPDGAVLVSKAVIAPKESNIGGVPAVTWVNTPSEEFGKTHCGYCFGHLVDGELVDGDKYVIAINADTLERVPIVQRTPYYITGSVEASDASARAMIWDGSCPGIRTTPYYGVPARYSYDILRYWNGNRSVGWETRGQNAGVKSS